MNYSEISCVVLLAGPLATAAGLVDWLRPAAAAAAGGGSSRP